jgi:hypothetical protein
MRFFKPAQRPGAGRRIAAVVAAVAVVAVMLAVDARWRVWPAAIDAAAVLGPGPGPVASGKIENTSWQIFFRSSRPVNQNPGSMCIDAALGDDMPELCGRFPPPGWPAHPVWFYDSTLDDLRVQVQVQYALGGVDADVTSVVLRLNDGQQLKLIPVSRYSYRLVAFVIPLQVRVTGATAYLNNGRYATTIPSYSPDGLAYFNSWVWHGPDALAATT